MGGGSVAGLAGVDDGDAAPGAGEDQGGGQPGGAAADDRDVVDVVMSFMAERGRPESCDNDCCRFRESALNDRVAPRPAPTPGDAPIAAALELVGRGCARCASSAA